MLRKVAANVALLITAAVALQAQDVIVMPGAASTGQSVAAFAASPVSLITSLSTGTGAFVTLSANGNLYVIGTSTSVTVSNASFASPLSIGSFTQAATGAALTPDGSRLAVAAGALHVFSTASNTELGSTSGISVSGVNIVYVAAGLDGKSFFTVGATPAGGTQLNSIDALTLAVTGTLSMQGTATSITVGPNGLIYVATTNPNQLVEVNPNTLTVTSGGLISLGGPPTTPVFTADGQYLLVIGRNTAVYSIGLASHSVLNTQSFSSGIPLDALQITGANTAAAFSSSTGNLYQITLGLSGILTFGPFTALPSGLSAITVSNEVPSGSPATKSALYGAAAGVLYRVDLPTNTVTQAAIPTAITPGALSYLAAPLTGITPTQLLAYGNNQTLAPSATSLPLVVQALDPSGHPLSGVSVTFTSNSSSAVVSPTAATTGANGYALTYLTAPSTAGTVQVTATAGSQTALFSVTVATSSTGAPSGLSIVAGQGQLLPEGSNTASAATTGVGSSLVVLVTDNNGNPVSGAAVTYTVTQGQGAGALTGGVTTATANTGSNGQASIDFQASFLGVNALIAGYYPVTVQATSGNNVVTFYLSIIPGAGTSLTVPDPFVNLIAPTFGTVLNAQAGQPVSGGAVTFQVRSSTGIFIPNVGVTLTNGGLDPTVNPSATCANQATVLTDSADGMVTCNLVAGPGLGTAGISASVGYFSNFTNVVSLSVSAGPPGKVNIVQGNNQSGAPGQTLPLALKVQVTDGFGNILAGTPVSWQVTPANAVTLTGKSSATDLSGFASALATLGNVAGAAQVTVTAGSVSATFTVTVNIAAAGLQKVSGDSQTTLISTAFAAPLVVKVVDSKGNPVQGAPVNFAVTAGSATLGSATAATGATGQASTTVTAGSSAGAITVTATTATFSVTFNLTSNLPGPTNITFVNGASFMSGSTLTPAISPGGITIISGTGIAPGVQSLVTANNIVGPLQTSLAGVTVTFNGTLAPIYYISNSGGTQQVAVQVPFEVTPGTASVVINSPGGGSATVSATVAPYSPAAFTTTIGGQPIAVAQRPDGSFVSPTNTAVRGEVITFYVTGLGQTTPATATGDSGIPGQQVAAPLIVGINNGGVPVISATYVQGLVGVYAVSVQIPASTATGNAQPFGLIVTDAQSNQYWMQAAFIPIR